MSNPLYDRLFARHAGRTDPFLLLRHDGNAMSYAAFLALAARLAHGLGTYGVTPGDRVAVQIEKSPEALALYAACAQAGAVFLPLNTAYTEGELSYFLENSGARLVVAGTERRTGLAPVATALGAAIATLDADGSGTLMDVAAAQPDTYQTVDRAEDDLAALLYTSGTTGRSKGAMLSQKNLLCNAETLTRAWHFTSEDVLLHALPIFHTHGLFVATNITLMAGGSMIFLPKFDLDQIIDALPRATSMMGVPTFYTRLLGDRRFTRRLAAHMRLFVSGSAPLLAETHRQFEDRTGHRILERYGMTETNMSTSNPYEGARKPGTVGPPLPDVDLKVTNPETGEKVADGETGMIEVRGPNVFQGYWQMPEKTAEEMRPDGFFITGDLGRVDEDGYVQIVGRQKDLIISGGLNIYPKELEVLLDDQPGILESAVIGVPHPDFGETPVAIVVPEPGASPDLGAVEAAITQRLARFKHPGKLILVEALPRNTMGKVQKNLLRETYGGLFR